MNNLEEMFDIKREELFKVFLCICNCLANGCTYIEIIKRLNSDYLYYFAAVGIISLSKEIGKEILNNES